MSTLQLSQISIDGGTQARAALSEDVVADYAEAIRGGTDFPPITVFYDGKHHWLADGFHRFHAYRTAKAIEIEADVHHGTKRDAILHSVGANAHHGLRRSNADKRCAVQTLLRDKEWRTWSDRQIADACGVSHPFVAHLRHPERANDRSGASRDAVPPVPVPPKPVVTVTSEPQETAPLRYSASPVNQTSVAGEEPVAVAPIRSTPNQRAAPPPPAIPSEDPEGGDHVTDDQLILELQQRNQLLDDLVKAAEADDQKAESVKWRRLFDNSQRRQGELMDLVADSRKREKRAMDWLMACGKAVEVDDPRKVAAAVKRLAAQVKDTK